MIGKSNLKMFRQFWKKTTVADIGSCHSVTSWCDWWEIPHEIYSSFFQMVLKEGKTENKSILNESEHLIQSAWSKNTTLKCINV